MKIIGIYKIENIVTKKFYIGSSNDVNFRYRAHLSKLKNNSHNNKHLQSTYNKYGIQTFSFSILEECDINILLEREQFYIDSFDWNVLYNKTRFATGGGSDAVIIPLFLLNLQGGIVKKYKSGIDLAQDLKMSIAPYNTINTSSIFKKIYRVVSTDFYKTDLETILKWKSYSNYTKYKSILNSIDKYEIEKDSIKTCFNTKKAIALHLNITTQRISQIYQRIDTKGIRKYFHKKSGYSIQYVKNSL